MPDAHASPVTVSASFDHYFGNVQYGVDPRSPSFDYRTRTNGVDVRRERAIAANDDVQNLIEFTPGPAAGLVAMLLARRKPGARCAFSR